MGALDRKLVGGLPRRDWGAVRGLVLFWCVMILGAVPVMIAQKASEWRVYRAADGLTESLTTAVTISPRGNLLVKHGEVDAVSYLDGYSVRQIPAPAEPNYRVYQSAAGRIWSIYAQGVLEYIEPKWVSHQIRELRWDVDTNPLRAIRPTPLLPAEEDRVLLLLPDRLAEYRMRTAALSVLRPATETGLGRFLDMTAARDGGIWVTGANGLAKVPGRLRQIARETRWIEYPLVASLGVGNLLRPFEDDDGGVTMVADSAVLNRRVMVHFDGTNWTTKSFGESLRFAWRDTEPDRFWAVTVNSLLHIDGNGGDTSKVDLPAAQFFDVGIQPRGVFWLATLEGLWRYAPLAWRTPPAAAQYNSVVHSAIEDVSGRLWFAAATGLLEADHGVWRHHAWPEGFDPVFSARDGLFALADGRLLISAAEQFWTYSPEKDGYTQTTHPLGRRLRKVLRQLLDGSLCVQTADPGADGGDYSIELFDGNRFVEWEDSPPPIDMGGELFFLCQAQNGDVWLGGRTGPAVWREGKWQRFTSADGYTDDGALCWLELPEGQIWCGGLGKVIEFDGRNWTVVISGLDRVSAMRRVLDGSVWVATGSGLYRHYKEAWAWVGEQDGLASNACYGLLEDQSRRLWVGTSRGVSLYFPRADTDAPRTSVTGVVQTTQGASENVVEVSFQGRDKWRFTPEDRLLFSHRLDGGTWSPFTRNTTAIYRDLASGAHRFEVRAMDRNWNIELRPSLHTFRVVVPWYQEKRIIAVGIAGLVAALSFAALATNRHLRLRRSHAEVEREVAERTRELERATAALAHGEKMTALGTLAAGIAHDFNNMLSIIRGSAQVIESNLDDRQKILTRVDRIKTVVDQASGIVRAMLGFGRVSDQQSTSCDAAQVVEETVRLLGDRFLREVNLRIEIAADLTPVQGSKELLQQMLLNLVLNAADSLDREGEIAIRVGRLTSAIPSNLVLEPCRSDNCVLIEVSDTGAGIAPDVLPRVFEPFYTTKAFSTRRGTGLGLYMVYEFARQMGHGLAVESTKGEGSKFTIIAPAEATGTLQSRSPDQERNTEPA